MRSRIRGGLSPVPRPGTSQKPLDSHSWRRVVGLETKAGGSESRFAAYVEAIASALGHADRAAPFQSYCAGLLLPGDRKSVEPMAARVQPARVQAAHQSLHHFVAKSQHHVAGATRRRFGCGS